MVFTCEKKKNQKTKGEKSTPVRSNAFSFFGSGVQHPPLTYPNPLHTNTLLSLLNDDMCSKVQHLLWIRQAGMETDCSTAEHEALCPQRHDTEPSIWIPRPLEGHRQNMHAISVNIGYCCCLGEHKNHVYTTVIHEYLICTKNQLLPNTKKFYSRKKRSEGQETGSTNQT